MTTLAQADALGVDVLERHVGSGPAAMEIALTRAAALSTIAHPGVLKPLEVRQARGGAVVAVMPRLEGHDLAQVLQARGSLRAGECVTVGVGVALALAAMHRAGLAHGDVSPANVLVNSASITVVDTMAGANSSELGTAGYAAPERGGGATGPADVYSLGRVLADAVREADRDVIDAWVAPMLATDPGARPSAAMVARALEACAEPLTVHMPALGVADAMRTRALSTALPTTRKPEARWWRLRKAIVGWAVSAVAGGVALAVALTVLPPLLGAGSSEPAVAHERSLSVLTVPQLGPETAAAELTQARFEALAAGDAEALLATAVEGSQARDALEPLAGALASGAMHVEGIAVAVDEVDVIAHEGRTARTVVTYTVAAHSVVMDGEATAYEGYTQSVALDLVWSRAGWHVERASVSQP